MARVPNKHSRDQLQDFEGLLNNLQDWEMIFQDKDKKLKAESRAKETLGHPTQKPVAGNASQLMGVSVSGSKPTAGKSVHGNSAMSSDYMAKYDSLNHLSSSLLTDENSVDANSEKELGNEYFKQKKFNDAIDCYSRSIALSPTALAYANRAMAHIKINRFQEAENDCTEALSLDDRYIKAYSRRATARKALGKLKECLEDTDIALRLEPSNQDIKKQHAEVKTLLEEEILKKASVASQKFSQRMQKTNNLKEKGNKLANGSKFVSSISGTGGNRELISDACLNIDGSNTKEKAGDVLTSCIQSAGLETTKRTNKNEKQDLDPSVKELAARAATLAMVESAKSISPPKTAYQFELSWRGFCGDRNLQSQLLKATSPAELPQLFKSALSAPMLIDIVRCVAAFFIEDMDLAVKYLENLTKIPRFDMIIMCLPSIDKADLFRIWDEVLSKSAPEYVEILRRLQPKYKIPQQ